MNPIFPKKTAAMPNRSHYSKMPQISRRRFLGQAGCAALGSNAILSTLLNLRLANGAAAQSIDPNADDRRTLVCVFLHGGIDSFNMLLPVDSRYAEYATSRSNLALANNGSLHPLTQAAGNDGGSYALHPSMSGAAELFNGLGGDPNRRRLALVANIGTLVRPTSLSDYHNGTVPLPRALFSHIDQAEQWQTSVPQGQTEATGWAGRAADVLHSHYNEGLLSMSISIQGNNVFQVGRDVQQFVATPQGGMTFTSAWEGAPTDHPLVRKNLGIDNLMNARYRNLMEQAYADVVRDSTEAQERFQGTFDTVDTSVINARMPDDDYFQDQLRAAARVILARESLGLRRQTLFVGFGGWDHHDELLDTQAPMLTLLSRGLYGFQRALEDLGLADSVVTFTASDFGRTLRSNGRGTDHAWGGNQLVMGGPVRGGRVYGAFPDLSLDGPHDVGQGGRLLPTTSVDELYGDLLRWFGVSISDLDYVLPNARNFFDPASGSPLGLFA